MRMQATLPSFRDATQILYTCCLSMSLHPPLALQEGQQSQAHAGPPHQAPYAEADIRTQSQEALSNEQRGGPDGSLSLSTGEGPGLPLEQGTWHRPYDDDPVSPASSSGSALDPHLFRYCSQGSQWMPEVQYHCCKSHSHTFVHCSFDRLVHQTSEVPKEVCSICTASCRDASHTYIVHSLEHCDLPSSEQFACCCLMAAASFHILLSIDVFMQEFE